MMVVRKDFRVRISIKNNQLVSRREEMGLSARAAALEIGVSYGILLGYEGLKRNPVREKYRDGGGVWKDTAIAIADFYRCLPEDLWTEEALRVEKTFTEMEMSLGDIATLVSVGEASRFVGQSPEELMIDAESRGRIQSVVDSLAWTDSDRAEWERGYVISGSDYAFENAKRNTGRHVRILKKYIGTDFNRDMTREEVGEDEGISGERVRQIMAMMFGRVRRSKRKDELKDCMGGCWTMRRVLKRGLRGEK